MDGQISLRSDRTARIQPHRPQRRLTSLLHKTQEKNPIRIRLIPNQTNTPHSAPPPLQEAEPAMSPVTALLAGAAALPPLLPAAAAAAWRPSRVAPAGHAPRVGGGCALAVECSSRPQKKATKHHMKTRPKKSQPWDIKRRPTRYPPRSPLPPDWTLVATGATVDASVQAEDEEDEQETPEPVAAPVVEVVAAPAAAD
ncbi:atherin [Oryza brachyantha]|uniref:atherin n=1 Tax=Oryza brachyantha TaxID=4533 RepID=UPI001ADCD62F|nr:atherin [Oryza brachyantha]